MAALGEPIRPAATTNAFGAAPPGRTRCEATAASSWIRSTDAPFNPFVRMVYLEAVASANECTVCWRGHGARHRLDAPVIGNDSHAPGEPNPRPARHLRGHYSRQRRQIEGRSSPPSLSPSARSVLPERTAQAAPAGELGVSLSFVGAASPGGGCSAVASRSPASLPDRAGRATRLATLGSRRGGLPPRSRSRARSQLQR